MLRLKSGFAVALLVASAAAFAQPGFRNASYSVRKVMVARPSGTAEPATEKVVALEFVVTSSERFPARALDPILYLGDVEVRQYRYADITNKTLIFTMYETDKLQEDVPVYLQYGQDARTRTDLAKFSRTMIKGK